MKELLSVKAVLKVFKKDGGFATFKHDFLGSYEDVEKDVGKWGLKIYKAVSGRFATCKVYCGSHERTDLNYFISWEA